MSRYRRRLSTSDIILMALAAGVISASPIGVGILVRNISKDLVGRGAISSSSSGSEEARIRASLYRLEKGGYVKKKIQGNKIILILTQRGRSKLAFKQGFALSIEKMPKWDGLWRFAMFDIPEKERSLRRVLRDTIRNADFFQIQKSIWVHPYPCTEEIEKLADSLGIRSYLLLFEGRVDKEELLKKFFTKKGYHL